MDYIDTFLKSKNKEALEALRGSVVNMLPIVQGREETTVQDEDGNTSIVPAVGDPEYFYTCVRAVFPLYAFDDVELSSFEEASPLCGAWL